MCGVLDGFEMLLSYCYVDFWRMRIMECGASQYMYGCSVEDYDVDET
jgi:hypothetical protein